MSESDRWIAQFVNELTRRDVPENRIQDEVDTVRNHIQDTGEGAEASFGDPFVYAASIAQPETPDSPDRATVFCILGLMATFIVCVIAGVNWIHGDRGAAAWCIVGALAMVTAAASLSVLLTRRAVATALRDHLTQETNARWKVSSSLLAVLPWAFVAFATIVLGISALR